MESAVFIHNFALKFIFYIDEISRGAILLLRKSSDHLVIEKISELILGGARHGKEESN